MNLQRFDRARRDRLRKAYDAAVAAKQEQFNFEGNDLLVAYAKYLLEYLDSRLGLEPKQLIGQRVELPAHYDAWARGAKFGTVTGFKAGTGGVSDCLLVKMDHPGIKRRVKLWRIDWDSAKFLGRVP